MNKGKCFSKVNRGQRKKSDFYETPYSLVWQLFEHIHIEKNMKLFDPACGNSAIITAVKRYSSNIKIKGNDIKNGYDFLKETKQHDIIITNPPFSLANEFIEQCCKICKHNFYLLMPLVYLHGQNRYEKNLFSNLSKVLVFTRMPMLGEDLKSDGKYHTGMQVYAWYEFGSSPAFSSLIGWIDNSRYVIRKKDE